MITQKSVQFTKKYHLLIILGILFLGLFFQRYHILSYFYGEYYGDEYHTIHQGISFLVHGKVENFRTGESVRWLVRAFYPYALVSMNSKMGGNVFQDGWDYPGHFYVIRNFVDSHNVASINNDPNLRDLFNSLRKQYLLFVLISFFPLAYFFYKRKYYIYAVGSILLLGINIELIAEQRYFYIEPAMIASISLALFLYVYFLNQASIKKYQIILYGAFMAFMLGTKLSIAPLLLLPLILLFYQKDALRGKAVSLIIFFVSFAGAYIIINFPAWLSLQSFNQFLHDATSNFWQYSAGSSGDYTVASGANHFSLILRQLEGLFGYVLYILPVIFLWGWHYATREEKKILLPCFVTFVFIAYILIYQHIFLARNLLPFYPLIILPALLSLDIIRRSSIFAVNKKIYVISIILVAGLLFGISRHAGGWQSLRQDLYPSSKQGFLSAFSEIYKNEGNPRTVYAIGFPEHFFDSLPGSEKFIALPDAPLLLNANNYPAFAVQYSKIARDGVVAVNRVANNKHLTNYLLPKYFSANRQFGNYYLFYNNE